MNQVKKSSPVPQPSCCHSSDTRSDEGAQPSQRWNLGLALCELKDFRTLMPAKSCWNDGRRIKGSCFDSNLSSLACQMNCTILQLTASPPGLIFFLGSLPHFESPSILNRHKNLIGPVKLLRHCAGAEPHANHQPLPQRHQGPDAQGVV